MSDGGLIERDRNTSYSVIGNTCLRDSRLSGRARGIFAYIMTLPDDWKLYRTELYTHFPEGRRALDTAFKELQDLGYITKKPIHERGRLNGWRYRVREKPTADADTDASGMCNTESRQVCNRQVLSTDEPSTEENLLAVGSQTERREGSATPSGEDEAAHMEAYYAGLKESAKEAARIWAEEYGHELPKTEERFHDYLLKRPEVYGYELVHVVRTMFAAAADPESGWKTRYRHVPAFLKNFDAVADFMSDYYAKKSDEEDELYQALFAGYRHDLDKHELAFRKLGTPEDGLRAFLDPDDDRTDLLPPFVVALMCPEDRLKELPVGALEFPKHMDLAERFYRSSGYGKRIDKIKEILDD